MLNVYDLLLIALAASIIIMLTISSRRRGEALSASLSAASMSTAGGVFWSMLPYIYYGVGHGPDAQLWILYALIAALMLFASWLTYRFFFAPRNDE
ncbi:hypothetical protein J3A72_000541 [Stenotrophomonas sp. PvP093]|uniref:hypothetical protein n=1 Tax=unclassified Stenotrophomonas TaxID=196198 RepID=UPI001AE68E0B|nr:hypothetical protein [Stenotrophomonas sp. PvP093]MBP2480249.1 hypothetical protein [Stenotrophomonas sp. PvP093]